MFWTKRKTLKWKFPILLVAFWTFLPWKFQKYLNQASKFCSSFFSSTLLTNLAEDRYLCRCHMNFPRETLLKRNQDCGRRNISIRLRSKLTWLWCDFQFWPFWRHLKSDQNVAKKKSQQKQCPKLLFAKLIYFFFNVTSLPPFSMNNSCMNPLLVASSSAKPKLSHCFDSRPIVSTLMVPVPCAIPSTES